MNLLILDNLAEEYRKALGPKFKDLSISTVKTTMYHEILEKEKMDNLIEDTDILFCTKISNDLIRRASKLKWIQCRTSGVDYLTSLPSLRKKVLITSTRGIHGPQMTELTLLLILALAKNFPRMIENQQKHIWERWSPPLLQDKKIGLLGEGVCGKELARKCKALGMTVYGIATTKRKMEEVDYFHTSQELLHVLREVDYFVILAPLTPQTKKMIDAKALAAMKPTAFLINMGRGEIVDEEALIETLRDGKIAGAALDSVCTEPLPKDSPLWNMKNAIITSHMGGYADVYVEQVLSVFEENLRRFAKGERDSLLNLIKW